jgi:hypothetical protein
MPYQKTDHLPGDRASKIGYMGIMSDDYTKNILGQFEIKVPSSSSSGLQPIWHPVPNTGQRLRYIFTVDGSYQNVEQKDTKPYTKLSYIQTVLYKLDLDAIDQTVAEKGRPIHPVLIRITVVIVRLFHLEILFFQVKILSILYALLFLIR